MFTKALKGNRNQKLHMAMEAKSKEKQFVLKDGRNAQLKTEIESDRWWKMEFHFRLLGLGQMMKWNPN